MASVGARGRRRVAWVIEDLKEETVTNACGECPSKGPAICVTAWSVSVVHVCLGRGPN